MLVETYASQVNRVLKMGRKVQDFNFPLWLPFETVTWKLLPSKYWRTSSHIARDHFLCGHQHENYSSALRLIPKAPQNF